jgi:hypothetical protein
MIRNTTSVNAVSTRIRNVIRMDMQRQFYQVCSACFTYMKLKQAGFARPTLL